MNHKTRNITLICLVMLFSLGLLSTSYGQEKFEFDIDVGFDGYVKPEEPTPVRIEVKNNFKDIEGKIELLVNKRHNKKVYYNSYSKKINIAKDSTKIINLDAVFYSNDLLHVRIVDKNGNVVFKKMAKYLKMNRPDGMFMGVFSENVDSLRYLSKIQSTSISNGSRDNFFEIAGLDDTLPENHRTLKIFQTMVINNYDSEKLNEKQRQAVKEWVEAGGLLLIGTGPNYQKTLTGMEDINFIEVKGTKEISIDDFGGYEPLKLVDASLRDGEEIFIKGNNDLKLYHRKLGKGHIVIAGFDMGLSPFVNWDGKDKFIGKVINKYLNSDIANYERSHPTSRSHWFNNIVNYLPYNLLPSMKTILIILILFILLVGPINYFVLKRIDKRELLWVTIPIIVVVFSTSIYILGFKTRLRQPISNNVSIIKIDDESKTAMVSTRAGLMGFKNGDWHITLDKNSEALLDGIRDYDVLQRFGDKEVVTEYIFDKENHVIFKKAGILDVETITINNEIEFNDEIVSDIVIKDGKLVGTVNNIPDLNLQDMIIFYGSRYKKLGDFKEGEESKKFEVYINKKNTVKDWYGIMDSIYGYRGSRSKNAANEAEDILNNNVKRDILEGLMDSKLSLINRNRFFILAWNKDDIGSTIKINGKEAKNINRNLLLIPLNIKYEKGQRVNIPAGILYPDIVDNHNMSVEGNGELFYGEGYVVLKFKPQDNMELNSMGINLDMGYNQTKCKLYVFDYIENEWVEGDKRNMVIDASNMDKYYTKEKGTLIKIDPTEDIDVPIPTFTVEGVIK